MAATDTSRAIEAIEAVFRIESPKLIAGLAQVPFEVPRGDDGRERDLSLERAARCAAGSRA